MSSGTLMGERAPLSSRWRTPIRLEATHRRAIYWTLCALWISGVLWLIFHYWLPTEGTFGPAPHPLEQWWLRLHGLAAMVTLVAIGSVLPNHVRNGWRRGGNRASAMVFGLMGVWLVATGYALYYLAGMLSETWLSLLHWLPGVAIALVFWAHVRHGRARSRRACPSLVTPAKRG